MPRYLHLLYHEVLQVFQVMMEQMEQMEQMVKMYPVQLLMVQMN